jgi:hypothetical protein
MDDVWAELGDQPPSGCGRGGIPQGSRSHADPFSDTQLVSRLVCDGRINEGAQVGDVPVAFRGQECNLVASFTQELRQSQDVDVRAAGDMRVLVDHENAHERVTGRQSLLSRPTAPDAWTSPTR